MSHFTQVKTKMVDLEFLKKALTDLGYAWSGATHGIKGYLGQRTAAEIKIPTRDPDYEIGFIRNGPAFECVADWNMIRDVQPELLLQKITQRYSYHAARSKLEEQGFSLADEKVDNQGRIHLVLRRMQ